MYRVLIVDDEPEIRQGLRLKADFAALRLSVIGEAGNGQEAMERLACEAIDIVITDMNMPVMNGVSFLEDCRRLYPELKLIVITGYEDFHYARAAVRNQARDYLLKPVASDELTAVLRKVKEELDKERNSRDQQAVIEWRLSQYYKEMKEHFLVHLVKEDAAQTDALRERAVLFELGEWDAAGVYFVTAGLRERSGAAAQPPERTPGKLRLPFELLGREFAGRLESCCQVFTDHSYPGLIHFIVQEGYTALPQFSTELAACITAHLGFEPVIGCSSRKFSFREWKDGFMEALLAWNLSEHSLYPGEGNSGPEAVLTEELSRTLRRQLQQGEHECFSRTAQHELQQAFSRSRACFVKLIFQLYLLVDAAAGTPASRPGYDQQLWLHPERVHKLDSVDKAVSFLTGLAGQTLHHPQGAGDSDESVIRTATQYIDSNYMYDLNLTELAKRFNYNSSYFSELFKAKVGTSFIAYLTEIRMTRAIHLLTDTTLGLWDIAELTGFSNASYFSSKFKKIYGMAPSDFRQNPPEKFNSQQPKK
ncbi:response regulator [Paenibacillus sp. MMS20-IR301]|uniref:response regulator transcription factor n=1 Tax=Paenibacillus sp. MMS20-IR301 TaxID=2895946 RepID=UPI0028E9E951|nr:response regulator [Paenibacillus sp. MMS20-IR301]WNS45836.1 response regulator [Paenibacillus sp. MMS20-IR301]